MTKKEAIELAIKKGGYFRHLENPNPNGEDRPIVQDQAWVLQDPFFWQSLNRAFGWSTIERIESNLYIPNWEIRAREWFDSVLSGTEDKFWSNLN